VKILLTIIVFILLIFKWPDKALVLIAFLAVLVALFKEDIYSFYKPPFLSISVPENLDIGDEVDAKNLETGEFVEKQAYFVITVENRGIGIAKNIEVYFNGLDSNAVKNFGRYKYLPLITSWTLNPYVRSLPPDVGMRFSVCFLRDSNRNEINFVSLRVPNALCQIKCKPDASSFFKFEVIALSDNARLAKREIEIRFMGNYLEGFRIKSM